MTLRLAAGALAAAAFAGAALAQTTSKPASAAPQPVTRAEVAQKVDAEFKSFDTNGDGRIARTEIEAAVTKRAAEADTAFKKRQEQDFRKIDTDRNGQLSLAEFQAAVTLKPKAGLADQRLQALDSNKDGAITPNEFRTPILARFDRVDTNKDGTITEAEERAAVKQATASRR